MPVMDFPVFLTQATMEIYQFDTITRITGSL